MTQRLPTVGVMGASDRHLEQLRQAIQTLAQATQLGRSLTALAVNLLTGGGGGMMRAVCKGFASASDRTGKIVGIIPGPDQREGYPNDHVEIVIRTHLPGHDPTAETSSNHINILTTDAVIALPGGPGTAAEVELAGRYDHPLALNLGPGEAIGNRTSDEWSAHDHTVFDQDDELIVWHIRILSLDSNERHGR